MRFDCKRRFVNCLLPQGFAVLVSKDSDITGTPATPMAVVTVLSFGCSVVGRDYLLRKLRKKIVSLVFFKTRDERDGDWRVNHSGQNVRIYKIEEPKLDFDVGFGRVQVRVIRDPVS